MTAKSSIEDSGSTASVRNVVVYSFAILAMPIIGEQLGEFLKIWRLLELIEAIPAIVCAFFVSRIPRAVKAAMHIRVRAACLIPLSCWSCWVSVVCLFGSLPSIRLSP